MRRRSSLFVALLVAATGLLAAPVALAQDTTGTGDEPSVRAFLHTVGPAAPVPGDTLVLAGTIENTGGEALHDVQALLRYSRNPLDDRTEVRRVATDQQLRWGQRNIDYFDQLADPLGPGDTADYRLEVPVDDLGFDAPGVYVVGVDIRVDADEPDERLTVNTSRTVIPWLPNDDPLPDVPVAMLWPLATQPSLLPDGTLSDDRLAELIRTRGPLSALVDAPGDTPVSWVIDPDLLGTVEAMSDGYEVAAADGSTTAGQVPPMLWPGRRPWPPRPTATSRRYFRTPTQTCRRSPVPTPPRCPPPRGRRSSAPAIGSASDRWPGAPTSPGPPGEPPTRPPSPRSRRRAQERWSCPATESGRLRTIPLPG